MEVEVDDLLDEFTPQTRRNFQQVLYGLGDGLASRGQDFNDTLSALRPLTKDSRDVFGEIAAPSTQLARLLRTYTATADELAARPESLAGILRSGATRDDSSTHRERSSRDSAVIRAGDRLRSPDKTR